MKNNADISGPPRLERTITIKNNLDACGNMTRGPGRPATQDRQNFTQCPGYNTTLAAEPFDLQPVDISKATSE